MWSSLIPLLLVPGLSSTQDRFVHLDGHDPYYPSRDYPRLVTPQWVGEEGVEAVVVLSIDDLRAPEPYERFLRPILRRLHEVEGRAPVSVMINSVDTAHPQLQAWLDEGLSLEVHTLDHPCPLLHGADLPRARSTYEGCIDLLAAVPRSAPVAFRMPCCDSINSVSPRFFAEVFDRATDAGNFLTIDSSVFMLYTAADPTHDPERLRDESGRERFRRLVPADRSFVNTIEDYPYPYPIGKLCWELPCVVPSDWEAQHHRGPNHPNTVEDLKAALDLTVAKQGVFTLVFHPHNWIQARHIIELIDHTVATHGDKVRFLSFRDVQQRLDAALFPLRSADGGDAGVRVLDLDGDGYSDVVKGAAGQRATRRWVPAANAWVEGSFPISLLEEEALFGAGPTGEARLLADSGAWRYLDGSWVADAAGRVNPSGARLRDLDGDGVSELIVATPERRAVHRSRADGSWQLLPFAPPVPFVDAQGRDAGTRLVDLDGDGYQDLVASNEQGASVHRLRSMDEGWSAGGAIELPPITVDGSERGAWFHSEHLWWQNEDTAHLANHVDRRSFGALLAAIPPGPRSPAAALRSIRVAPGLAVELVAAEPLVRDPIAFDWDARGRLFVVEMGDYPLGSTHGGRVRLLTDEDGDGSFERARTFLDGLAFPTGVAPWRDGVLITCAPDILFARDLDDDGHADEVTTIVSGFGQGNQQHRVNGLWWGLDNAYHGANGDSGGVVNGIDLRGRDFRLWPDEARVEPEAGQTQFGRTRDDWGNWFGGNNWAPCWHVPLAARYLARNPHVAPPPSHLPVLPGGAPVFPRAPVPARFNDPGAASHFTSACSPILHRAEYLGCSGDLFVCEPVHNLVHRSRIEDDGTTFRGRRIEGEEQAEFLASSDPWFRPTMVRTGPDGALWIADMARAVIEHPEWIPDDWQARLDLREGHELGRIYRVVEAANPPGPIPQLAAWNSTALVEALESPNGWVRDTAQRLLVERGQRDAPVLALERMAHEGTRATARLQALCALDGIGALRRDVLAPRLADEHPGVRANAARLVEPWLREGSPLPDTFAALAALTLDPVARVRLAAACSLGESSDPQVAGLLAGLLAREGADPYLRAAVMSSLRPSSLRAVFEQLQQVGVDPPLRRALAEFALRADQNDGRQALLAMVTSGGSLSERLVILDEVLAAGGETILAGAPLDDLLQEARLYLASSDPQATELGLRVLSRMGQEIDSASLQGLLGPRSSTDVQRTALVLLSERDDGGTAQLLLSGWREYAPDLRSAVLDVLLGRRTWTDAVVVALDDGRLRAHDLDATRRQLVIEHASPAQRRRASELLASDASDRAALVTAHGKAIAGLEGDQVRGRAIFRATCAQCHRLDGEGTAVGPDLRALADKSIEALLVAILDPNRAVEARYIGYTALTTDGLLYSGVLADESATSVTLRGADTDEVLLRADLEALSSTEHSQMPEGLEAELTPRALADLCAYLRGAGLAPKAFEGNSPALVRPGEDGALALTAADCEIFGPEMIFEQRYGNLGFWHTTDDLAAWTLELPAAGSYEVTVEYACPQNATGGTLVLGLGEPSLAWEVEPTGSWDDYQVARIGRVDLPAGQVLVTARAALGLEGYLLDLRVLRLTPAR